MITSWPAPSGKNLARSLVRADGARGIQVARVVAAFMVLCFAACTDAPRAETNRGPAAVSNAAVTSPNAVGDPRRGLALLTAFRDSLPAHSGNALRCTSCHLDNGTRANGLPWLGTAARYPRYRARRGGEENLTQRVNECITRSLAGKMLPEDSREIRDMIAYIETLRDRPRPAATDTVKLVGNTRDGAVVFTRSCARCHGANGEGGIAPAVAGVASYSIGAGLARQTGLATFVHANMPYDSAGTVSPQRSADVAAYVLSLPRQDLPGKEHDWPKGDAPADAAYATDAARLAGNAMPALRPLLPRRVAPGNGAMFR